MMNKHKLKIFIFITFLFIYSCSPGTHMHTYTSWTDSDQRIYVPGYSDNKQYKIFVHDIKDAIPLEKHEYLIGVGDQLSIVVWGLEEAFPSRNISPDLNLRTVHTDGNIYFPYVGYVKAANLTQNQVRNDIALKLSKYFNDPQLDVTIARYNSLKNLCHGRGYKAFKNSIYRNPHHINGCTWKCKWDEYKNFRWSWCFYN